MIASACPTSRKCTVNSETGGSVGTVVGDMVCDGSFGGTGCVNEQPEKRHSAQINNTAITTFFFILHLPFFK